MPENKQFEPAGESIDAGSDETLFLSVSFQDLPSNADELNSDSNSSGGARSTPTSSAPQHLSVGPLRPSRSPSVGSTGSRSNTPASITGQYCCNNDIVACFKSYLNLSAEALI